MTYGRFEFQTDLSPADWVKESMVTFAEGVRSLVPETFAAYARILHPASHGKQPVSWEAVARFTGRTMHPLVQFGNLSGIHQWDHRNPPDEAIWDRAPDEGNLSADLRGQLVGVLRHHTTTPHRCWFGAWVGWGDSRFPSDAPQLRLPARQYFLLSGPIEAIEETVDGGSVSGRSSSVLSRRRFRPVRQRRPATIVVHSGGSHSSWNQSASLWWPEDRAWFVATEIDLNSTYVGGSTSTIEALLASPGLEAFPVTPNDPTDWTSDSINPAPSA